MKKDKTLSRRDFIKKSSAAGVAISAAPVSMFSHAAGQPVEEMSVLTANASFDLLVKKIMGTFQPSFELIKYHVDVEKRRRSRSSSSRKRPPQRSVMSTPAARRAVRADPCRAEPGPQPRGRPQA